MERAVKYLEAHVEHLLGRRVRDVDGEIVGRLEEIHVENIDGDELVTEYHIGRAALIERMGAFITQLPFFRYIPFARKGYCISWTQLDLSDPLHPRATVPRADLQEMDLSRVSS